LSAYIDYLQAQGCTVILVRYGDSGKQGWLADYIRQLRERAVTIAREKGVIICDLVPAIEQSPRRNQLFIKTGFHVTKEGAVLVAKQLQETIQELWSKK
jgi:lysophospholipase L1-like esterase